MSKKSLFMTAGTVGLVGGLIVAIIFVAWQPIAVGLVTFLGAAFLDSATDRKDGFGDGENSDGSAKR